METLAKWDGDDAIVVEHTCVRDVRALHRVTGVTILAAWPLHVSEVIRCPLCGMEGRVRDGRFQVEVTACLA